MRRSMMRTLRQRLLVALWCQAVYRGGYVVRRNFRRIQQLWLSRKREATRARRRERRRAERQTGLTQERLAAAAASHLENKAARAPTAIVDEAALDRARHAEEYVCAAGVTLAALRWIGSWSL